MSTEDMSEDRATKFVQSMIGLCESSKSARAALRRSLSLALEDGSWRYLSPWIDLTDTRKRKIYTLVAGVLASERTVESGSLPLGKALRFAVKTRVKKEGTNKEPPTDPRFRRLLATNEVEDVLLVLPPMIRLIQSRCPGQLDYASLLRDLEWYGERVRARWARDFFQASDEQEEI